MIDVEGALRDLAGHRQVFHSEADLQHALAWRLHGLYPRGELRLERPCEERLGRIYLDIWLREKGEVLGVELKYKTRYLRATVHDEAFELRDQSAQDIARYDFLADVVRLEGLVETGTIKRGVAVFLTNDPGYWRDSGRRNRVDEAFRIHEGQQVQGELSWASHASDGTKKSRERQLLLRGRYTMNWRPYSTVDGNELRYVLLEVGG